MTVVFLHGLARTHRSMNRLRGLVERAGFPTWARTYPSQRRPIAKLADVVGDWLAADLPGQPLVAVTHSLGGIILRHLTSRFDWRGAVMMAPPNAGSALARRVRGRFWYRWYFGPAGQDVGDGVGWPAPPSPFVIVAGTRHVALTNPTSWASYALEWLPRAQPSDGTVMVSEARLPGAAAVHEVDCGHTWIMNHPKAADVTLDLLRTVGIAARSR